VALREELASVGDLGAFRQVRRNLIASGSQPQAVRVAEMTASGFSVARVPPFLGRTLVPDDERDGALPVAVIGYQLWRSRFAGDASIIGRAVQLGDTAYTVVGVPGEFDLLNLVVRVRGAAPAAFAGRVREIAAAVDPNLQLVNAASLDEILRSEPRVAPDRDRRCDWGDGGGSCWID
jgi:MacB-like periplasmic core domain